MSTSIISKLFSGSQQARPSMALGSGPGAPIFEPGPHTRIRRAPVRSIATLTWATGPRGIFAQVVNVSPSGCLIKTESTIPEGTRVDMSITILGDGRRETFDIAGTIVRQTTADGRRAYGVEFRADSRDEREALQWMYAEASR